MNVEESGLNRKVLSARKVVGRNLVLPVLTFIGVCLFTVTFRLDIQWFAALAIAIIAVLGNKYFVTYRPTFYVGKFQVDTSEDYFDFARWCFNIFLLDLPMFFLLKPDLIVLLGTWLILSISAAVETFEKKFRNTIFIMSFFGCAINMLYLYDDIGIYHIIFWQASLFSVLSFIIIMEKSWVSELEGRIGAEESYQQSMKLAKKLLQQANIGANAQMIGHEIGNLLTAIDFSTARREVDKIDIVSLRKSLVYIKNISSLLLKDTKLNNSRTIELGSLISDIEMLISRIVKKNNIEWKLSVDEFLHHTAIEEQSGTVYFILQNLIKNSVESILHSENKKNGIIELSIYKNSFDFKLHIAVIDNGLGMSQRDMELAMLGELNSTKEDGSGLGLKFVKQECERNNFDFFIKKHSTHSIESVVSIPTSF